MNGLPDLTGLKDYASAQVSAVLFIVLLVMMVRAFMAQRWGMFAGSLIFAAICFLIAANPATFESWAKALGTAIKAGGMS
ncbi:hypothetical protein D1872_205040 [compost metagenome]